MKSCQTNQLKAKKEQEELFMEDPHPDFDDQMVQAWASVKKDPTRVHSDCRRLVQQLLAGEITLELHRNTATPKEN